MQAEQNFPTASRKYTKILFFFNTSVNEFQFCDNENPIQEEKTSGILGELWGINSFKEQ